MQLVTEAETRRFADPELCMEAVRECFIALARGTAQLNPIVIGKGQVAGATFSVKSGWSTDHGVAGVKIGAYWPGNELAGLPRHNSTIFLIDQQTGRIATAMEAAGLNGLRTAAADAIATDLLARLDSETLSVIGSGNQAQFELQMLLRVRPQIRKVLIGVRDPRRAGNLLQFLADRYKVAAEVVDIETACRNADILVTATPSRAPLVEAGWVRPGTHISAMGADQAGKQELSIALLKMARLFADYPAQSIVVGEFQHVAEDVASGSVGITAIGEVLLGQTKGRVSADEITIFDSSGVALQDLLVAQRVLAARDVSSIGKSNNAI
ncbi:ornithine cyclodeaminase family protein [Mesorhizobium sp. DCY119]|uniref:ornithine cyclodeaminase family protein n=1 Tax=Mesorhizobium sp. DCY119 TaxID=2108445 RepID=UPI000E72BE93|nr:ornithine cyclodeaminase family protein [Mesorhizobium sp. DCY119]RJG41723.1 ornithine cyclodeaminase family protein [Mesorhizobium sp. DCY119]